MPHPEECDRATTDAAGPTRVLVRRLDPGLPLPRRAHPDDAGLDLRAATGVVLGPGERGSVPTGLAVALPRGCVGLVHPRSGLASRHGLTVLNAPGTLDAGYRGEVVVTLVNHDLHSSVTVHRGDRVAQLLVQRVEDVELVEVDEAGWPGETPRGTGGHGSSGAGRADVDGACGAGGANAAAGTSGGAG